MALTVGAERVEVATNPVDYERLWLSMARGEPPVIDFSREFVVQFVPPVSGTCPWIAFTGVGVNEVERFVFGQYEQLDASLFVHPLPDNFGCTTDARPHAFLVAIDRSVVPAEVFRVRLREERRCPECGITTDEIEVELGR